MTRRSGLTLVEVLVAIFVMGIGLIALLTLFPIGMLRMYQAIHDQSCAEAAQNAQANSLIYNIRNDPSVIIAASDAYNGGKTNYDLFANPWPTGLQTAKDYSESFPILVDPIGSKNSPAGLAQDWVGGVRGGLRRRSVSFANTNVSIYRSFTLWDNINFEADGSTNAVAAPQMVGTTVLRDSRFSWAYLFRRPQTANRSIVDCSIIVFDKRSMALSNSLTLGEYVYPNGGLGNSYFNPSNSTITIDYSGYVPPPVRAGDWILDATPGNAATTIASSGAHAYFYRIVATEDLGPNLVRFEVQNPLRGFNPAAPMANANGYPGTAIIIEGIAEVYDKGPVRLP